MLSSVDSIRLQFVAPFSHLIDVSFPRIEESFSSFLACFLNLPRGFRERESREIVEDVAVNKVLNTLKQVSIYLLLIYRYSYFRLFSGRSESIRNKLELNVSGSISSQTILSYLYMDHNYGCDYAMQMRDTSDERSPNEISIIWQHLDGLIWQRLLQFSRTSAVNLSACLCVFSLKSATKAIGNASTEHRAQDTARCIRIRRERDTQTDA